MAGVAGVVVVTGVVLAAVMLLPQLLALWLFLLPQLLALWLLQALSHTQPRLL